MTGTDGEPVCWSFKCVELATHLVYSAPDEVNDKSSRVKTCQSCAEYLVNEGRWDSHEPLAEYNRQTEGEK